MAGYRIISSDDHIYEPIDLWTSRMDRKYLDRCPRIERTESGGDWWICDEVMVNPVTSGSQAGRRFEEPEKLSNVDTYDKVRVGGYIPEEHIKDMDLDGIDVSVLYPTAGVLLYRVPDSDLLNPVFSAYNDWIAEFCSANPKRLKPIALVNADDVPAAVAELERCAKRGFLGAMISVYPQEDKRYDSPVYEPLWAAAEEIGMPLSLHIGTNRPTPGIDGGFDSPKPAGICNVDHWVRLSLCDIIFSGVFERHPKLTVGSVEHELSWAPHFLDRLDYTYTQRIHRPDWHRYNEDMLPSEYFYRNVFLGFQEDGMGIRFRDIIGVDNILWGSDYPHQESTFPRSQQILEDILSECTEEEKGKIAGGNAARIYHLG